MAARRLRVLHLVRWYPHEADPQIGYFLQKQIRAVCAHTEGTVIFVWPVRGQAAPEKSVHTEANLKEIRITYPARNFAPANMLTLMKLMWKAALEEHKAAPFDLIHAHILTRVGVVAEWLGRHFGVPYLISEHWSRYYPENDGFHGFWRMHFTAKVIGRAAALTTVSERLKNAMELRGLRHPFTRTVPTLVDTSVFRPSGEEKTGPLRWISISCFEERPKNLFGLIRAAAVLREEGVRFTLVFVGDGPDRRTVEAAAEAAGLSDCTRFTGMITQEEVAAELTRADYLVQPSRYETFGTPIIEAWACGVPVISTRTGVFAEVDSEPLGITVASEEVADIAAALRESISLRGSFSAATLREIAETRYGTAAVGKQLFDLYSEVSARAGNRRV